jgi:hypothetical protein
MVGAVLANQVASDLPKQAARLARELPLAVRPQFLAFWLHAEHSSQKFGAGQQIHIKSGADALPSLTQLLISVSHAVFANAFLTGARSALALVAVVLALGVPGCLLLRRRRRQPEPSRVDDRRGEIEEPIVRPLSAVR